MQIHYNSEIERKMLHLSSLWMAAFLYFFPLWPSVIVFSILFFGGLITEYGFHKKMRIIYPLYQTIFGHILRTKERSYQKFHLSGGIYVILSALICAIFFSKEVGAISMTLMLIGDTVAGLVGRKIGRTKIVDSKSLEGSLAFFISGLIIITVFGFAFDFDFIFYLQGLIAIVFATLSELFAGKLKMDDNLSIVLISGIILSL